MKPLVTQSEGFSELYEFKVKELLVICVIRQPTTNYIQPIF